MNLLAVVIGLGVGVLSGIMGLGGGIFLVPALVYGFKMSQHDAQGTSLATLLLPIGAFGFWEYYRAGHVDARLAAWLALGFAAGAFVGGRWAQLVDDLTLRRIFAVVLTLIAVRMWIGR